MSLKKNFIYNTFYQIFVIIIPIVTVPYISRILGPDGVGLYSYTASYAQYFSLFGMIGISLYGSRQIAYTKSNKNKLSKEFWNIYGLQFITTVISFIVYIVSFCVLNNNDRLIYLIQSIIVLSTVFDISWFFIGYEDMKSVVIRNTIVKILGVICIFIFVKDQTDVWKYVFIMAGSSFLGQVIMWLNLKDKVSFYIPKINDSMKHLKPALALFISQLAIQIYTLLDKTMLGYMVGIAEVGLYENSQKTIKLALTLITSLGVVMLPRISALYSEGNIKKVKEMIIKSFSFVNFLAFPMILGLIAVSNSFSVWFYGESFNGVGLLLKVGSLLMLAIGWSNILGIQLMLPMKKETQFTISVTVGAIINFVLNMLLIKGFGAVGTTIASVLAEFAVTGIQVYFLKDFINIKEIIKTTIKPIISSIVMFIVLIIIVPIFKIGFIWTLIELFIGTFIYIGIMFLFKDPFLIEGTNILKRKVLKK